MLEMSIKTIAVPSELKHSYLLHEKNICLSIEEQEKFNPSKLFIYDAAFYAGELTLKPWQDHAEAISALLIEWSALQKQLQESFKNRDLPGAKEPMKKGIGIFIELMHWTNGSPVRLSPQISFEHLSIKPVNVRERLDFILGRPVFYPSYIQLTELMLEMEKLYKKSIAMKKSV